MEIFDTINLFKLVIEIYSVLQNGSSRNIAQVAQVALPVMSLSSFKILKFLENVAYRFASRSISLHFASFHAKIPKLHFMSLSGKFGIFVSTVNITR
jgi:hypothetical protein